MSEENVPKPRVFTAEEIVAKILQEKLSKKALINELVFALNDAEANKQEKDADIYWNAIMVLTKGRML
jgi:hypothetical protein